MAKKNNTLIWLAVAGVVAYFYLSGNTASAGTPGSANMVSDSQLAQTANLESFSATPYPDGSANGVQIFSIGYGHQIQPGESFTSITPAQGQQLMLTDSANVVNALNNSGLTFTQGQYDGLWDFGYSAGIGALNLVLQNLANNGADAATQEILQYTYWHPTPGGPAVLNQSLVTRRNNEVATFNS